MVASNKSLTKIEYSLDICYITHSMQAKLCQQHVTTTYSKHMCHNFCFMSLKKHFHGQENTVFKTENICCQHTPSTKFASCSLTMKEAPYTKLPHTLCPLKYLTYILEHESFRSRTFASISLFSSDAFEISDMAHLSENISHT